MFLQASGPGSTKNTSYKVVLPFYVYAAVSFLVATIFLLTSSGDFLGHYVKPHVLAITHTMALGWGTMIILGASHQLVPVLLEEKLYSNKLANASFILAAIGIPLLVYGFYVFNMGWPAKWGGRFILIAVICYLINISKGVARCKTKNVHAVFVLTATIWLLLTVFMGLAQVYNFTIHILPSDSWHYLSLHAHAGILGWFLLLIIGVGSRLIPMFLISKYSNNRLLWWIYFNINAALVLFVLMFYFVKIKALFFIPILMVLISIGMFIRYCYKAYQQRIRKQVDEQVKLSLLSVFMLILPIILLILVITFLINTSGEKIDFILAYGFLIFFGWMTAIILGMTFKTLPFIVWNKAYHKLAGLGKTPSPKDLFSNVVFKMMGVAYILGLILFVLGILLSMIILLKIGATSLLLTAVLYNWNVLKLIFHKPKML